MSQSRDAASHPYPIFLDLRGLLAVVVGLGAVGQRRAGGLLVSGAHVRGVDPLGGGGLEGASGVEICAEAYCAEFLADARLVLACGPPEVNRQVVRDAQSSGIFVASSSAPESGNFVHPATHRDGSITLAVTTGGASPGLAITLRDRAAAAIPPAAAALATLLLDLRVEVHHQITDPTARRLALQIAGDPAWLDHLTHHGPTATRLALVRALGLN